MMRFSIKRQGQGQAFFPGPTRPRSDLSLSPNAESLQTSTSEQLLALKPRQTSPPPAGVSTCGYLNANGSLPRTADPGFDCRIDTKYALWGFCSNNVISPSDCGLAGTCIDAHACQSVCGIASDSSVTTATCTKSGAPYCSTALLIDAPDSTYSFLACASAAKTDTYYHTPTVNLPQASTSTSSVLSRATPSLTLASSTSSDTSLSPTSKTLSAISSALPSSSSLSIATPNPSNNLGAAVGGILGGLALLLFLTVAFLFYRRLKTPHTNEARAYDLAWQKVKCQEGPLTSAPREGLFPAELSSDGPTTELSGSRHGQTTELSGSRYGRTTELSGSRYGQTTELSGSRHGDATELPSHMRRSRHASGK